MIVLMIAERMVPDAAIATILGEHAREVLDASAKALVQTANAAGGRDNGAPGIREHYHPNYYGAFVYDPDGNNIEAVCHDAV